MHRGLVSVDAKSEPGAVAQPRKAAQALARAAALIKRWLASSRCSVPQRLGWTMARASAGRKPAELPPAARGAAVLLGSPTALCWWGRACDNIAARVALAASVPRHAPLALRCTDSPLLAGHWSGATVCPTWEEVTSAEGSLSPSGLAVGQQDVPLPGVLSHRRLLPNPGQSEDVPLAPCERGLHLPASLPREGCGAHWRSIPVGTPSR